ncbi:MAG: hypothetical protein CVV30_07065 [Methanomicrobiales archaeon HGW-Methanomicrobiales-1]|nr:MAG: hypothetical protein CVV30_07065 [Methanomicrobiales archaeon HGW-Methanomicrobiales-1]
MIDLTCLIKRSGICRYTFIIVVCLLAAFMILPVTGADASITAELGDTLTLHGVSYSGSSVYLFMTGPGLPENGVTLTDVSQRADKGMFTQIDLDSNQEWTFRWDTSRIENEIKAGTYLVYVTPEPVDKAHLGGSNTYKTLEVYLKDTNKASRVSISTGTSYTLNPEMHASTLVPILIIPSPTPAPTSPPEPVTTLLTAAPATPLPTTKSSLPPATVFLALLSCAGAVILYRD